MAKGRCLRSIVLILSVLFTAAGCSPQVADKKPPKAVHGVLDLRGWRFSKDGPVNLDGEWEFYRNKLLRPGGFPECNNGDCLKVPGFWGNQKGASGILSEKGFGTYRLTVLISDKEAIYAVKMGEVLTSYKLWIDNREVFSCGKVGRSIKDSTPKFHPHVTPLSIKNRRVEVVLQVSNHFYMLGGIRDSIGFGLEHHLSENREKSLATSFFLFGSVLIMAIYHFGLYGLRREDSSTLLFGIFCLIISSRVLSTNEMYIVSLFPRISWAAQLKTIVLGYFVGLPVFITFIYKLYPQDYRRTIIRFVQVVGLLSSLAVLLTEPEIYTRTEIFYQAFILLSSIYIIAGLFIAVKNGRDGARWVVGGVFVLFVTVVNDIMYAQNILILTGYQSLLPFGLFIFIFSQSYILSSRFSNAFRIANIDELSQVFNRRRFTELAEQEFLRSERTGKTLSLLSLDVDHFKSVNDTYGHDAGDLVLKTLAKTFKDNLRKPDIFGRMGGEEFALLLPETSLERAVQIAQRLCKLIGETDISVTGEKIRITVSIGAASNDDPGAENLEMMFKHADVALYAAKNNGRNRVEICRSHIAPSEK